MTSGKISEAMVEASYDAFTRSFASSPIGTNNTRNDLRAAIAAALSVPAPGTDKWLGELLAIIHRDGGQYQATHGVEKAVEDAHSILAAAFSTPQAGDLGAVKVIDAWAHFHDGELLSVTLRKETADAYRKNGLDVRQLAALSSTPVGEMDGWQPIETAPKIDGKRIFIGIGKRLIEAWWDDGYEEFLAVGDGGVIRIGPNTRWHAYPQPPVSTASPQGGR